MKRTEQTITMIGNGQLIDENELYSFMYKSMSWLERLKNKTSVEYLKKHTRSKDLIYHPIWLIKALVLADRKPFPPKKIPKMIFIDAVSGYRGLMATVPATTEQSIADSQIITPAISREEKVTIYTHDVQKRQINRSYLMKKPDHQIIESSLAYLPLWTIDVEDQTFHKNFVLNANTGESEAFMQELWQSGEWLHVVQ